ncbi:MAG: PKD domain-containing protein [Terriglobales bacterium]
MLVMLAAPAFAATLEIKPTTTLAAETANNTSAADTWTTSTNGNLGAGNVSKVDHRTLLYPGSTTQIYSNIMFWFGPSNHIQVGYQSNNYDQVKRQVDDHLSRGITGTIVDWYGTAHTWDNGATLYLKQYAESLPGHPFKFAIMEDKGALKPCAATPGCDVNAQLISDLTYIVNTYGVSPAYMKLNGRPVIFFFGVEDYAINWSYVEGAVPGNPLFIFENASGFNIPTSDGGFAWVMINTSDPLDWKQSYLDYFYSQARNYVSQHTFGATYKGFNDTAATWSLNRIMSQQCGQVWLNTWNEVRKFYSANNQLESMQIVTWNDYEEGTSIESGIDNCVTISANVSGTALNWTITGNENTLHHYTVFISTDGQNLMPLAEASPGIRSLDLTQFDLAEGNYSLYVKAVGKPSFANHMSGAATLVVKPAPPIIALDVTPTFGSAPLAVTASTAGPAGSGLSSSIDFGDGTVSSGPTAAHTYTQMGSYTVSATVTDSAGQTARTTAAVQVSGFTLTISMVNPRMRGTRAASYSVSAAPQFGFRQAIALSCSGLPSGASCNFSPSTITPSDGPVTAQLSIQRNSVSRLQQRMVLLALCQPLAGVALFAWARKRRGLKYWGMWSLLAFLGLLAACGGGQLPTRQSSSKAALASGTYIITVTGTSGGLQQSATATLTVEN